jgi:hypothetical protein
VRSGAVCALMIEFPKTLKIRLFSQLLIKKTSRPPPLRSWGLLAQFVLQLYNRLSDFPENASPLIHLVIISPPLLTMSIRTASVSSLLSEMSCSPRQITSSAPDSSPAVLDAFSRCESRSLLELGRPSACFFSRLTTCFDPH